MVLEGKSIISLIDEAYPYEGHVCPSTWEGLDRRTEKHYPRVPHFPHIEYRRQHKGWDSSWWQQVDRLYIQGIY